MPEYPPQEMAHIHGEPQYILHKIGPFWGIEQTWEDGYPPSWRFFDEETANKEWEKLKKWRKDD